MNFNHMFSLFGIHEKEKIILEDVITQLNLIYKLSTNYPHSFKNVF
jgi:hypothetical protein